MSKLNVHTAKKSLYFQNQNYSNPNSYEDMYNNEKCDIENEAIGKILRKYISKDITITDIGCGTGLGRRLLKDNRYIGIDRMEKPIKYCIESYKGIFKVDTIENYIKSVDKLNPIFLFSLDYTNSRVIEEYIKKTDKVFIAVHYNKPYLSDTSIYSNDKELYYRLHDKNELEKKLEVFNKYKGETFKLLDQDYYYVTIIKKG